MSALVSILKENTDNIYESLSKIIKGVSLVDLKTAQVTSIHRKEDTHSFNNCRPTS